MITRRTRRNHTPAFKAQVALAALKSDKTLAELAQQYDIHPNQITDWKRQLTERAVQVFGDASEDGGARNDEQDGRGSNKGKPKFDGHGKYSSGG